MAVRLVDSPVRVAAGMHFGERLDVDVGVNLGGFHALVAQHFLHEADVGAAEVHVGGAGMPPQVARAGFVDTAALEQALDPVAKVIGAEALAVAGEKECGFLPQMIEERPGLGEEAVEPGGGAFADGQEAGFSVFAFPDEQGAGGGIVVAVIELLRLRSDRCRP